MSQTALQPIVDGRNSKRALANGWRWVRLGDVCHVVGGSTPMSGVSEYWGADITWITPTDLGQLQGKWIEQSARNITQAGLRSCSVELVPTGSVVLSSRAPIGHLGIAAKPLCTNQGCKTLVPGPDIDSEFLYFALKHSIAALRALGSGATFSEISKSQVCAFEIALPSVQDQRAIATALEAQFFEVESARTAAEARLAASDVLAPSYLRNQFEGVFAYWPAVRLEEVCEITARLVNPTAPEYRSLPHVSGEDIESGLCRLKSLYSAGEDRMISSKYLFEPGNVLYSKLRPYLRKVAVAEQVGLCSADMYPIRVKSERLDPGYLAWLLLTHQFTSYADTESRRARMPKLNREQLFSWEAPLPPLPEQKRIATNLRLKVHVAIELKALIETELNAIDRLQDALLQRAFSG